MSLFGELENHAKKTALIYNDISISYNQLVALSVDAVKTIKNRTLIFLLCSNTPESIAIYLGAIRKKIVPVMINKEINKEMLDNLTLTYKPSFIFSPKNAHKFTDNFVLADNFGKYEIFSNKEEPKHNLYSDLAMLLTTSGSTGSPKLVRQSYENVSSNTNSIIEYLKITHEDRAITTMPMSYTYGLSIINSHLASGACLILSDEALMEKEFWSKFKTHKPTTFGGVPYIYEMLKKLRFERMDLSSLKYLTQAGGKLSPELSFEFATLAKNKGFKFIVMYGQTEATARMAYLPYESSIEKAGSMGIAIPNGRFELIDVEGEIITTIDTVGELVYYGKNVTLGYAESFTDLCKGDENGGKLITGDMAKVDGEGFYYIVGRKKRFLKLFGNRINLDEIEQMLKKGGYDCAASGVDDKMKIFVAGEVDEKEIKKLLSTTNINVSAFDIIPIEEIPRNESGKIAYSKLPQ